MKRETGVMNAGMTRADITISFLESMCSKPFMGQDGNYYTRIEIPESGREKRPSFVLPTNKIHLKQQGDKFLYARVRGDGLTKIRNLQVAGTNPGRNEVVLTDGLIPNQMLKAMVETNPEMINARDERASVLSFLRTAQKTAPSPGRDTRRSMAQVER